MSVCAIGKLHFVKYIIYFGLILVLTILVVFFIQLYDGSLSDKLNDMGNIGCYIGGILGTILTGLNFLVFFTLTKAALEFNAKSIRDQLLHSTCKEYHMKINDLSLIVMDNLIDNQRIKAKITLGQMEFIVDSFAQEIAPLIVDRRKENLNGITNELIETIRELVKELDDKPYLDKNIIQELIILFCRKKSDFIKSIFINLIDNAYDAR